MSGLVLEKLRILLEGRCLLSLDEAVAPGEVLAIMGPSGVGKTSLLHAIAGTLDPVFSLQGRVLLDGRPLAGLPPERRNIGLLFQDPLLFPHLSVAGNILFGVPRGLSGRREQVTGWLEDVGMAGFETRDPATLSGGQQARVALLRTLAARPTAVLLDEPFSRLDAALRDEIRQQVFRRLRAARVPVILVTHDEADAMASGGRIVRL